MFTKSPEDIFTEVLAGMAEGGRTIPTRKFAKVPHTGYVVATSGITMYGNTADLDRAIEFIKSEHKAVYYQVNGYFSVWVDQDTRIVYLDRVQIFSELATALEVAHKHSQLAIYDLSEQQEIRV